jgi:hypothetical protein
MRAPNLTAYGVVRLTTAGALRSPGLRPSAHGKATPLHPSVAGDGLPDPRPPAGPIRSADSQPSRSITGLRILVPDSMDVRVDYNDVDDDGNVLTLRKFFVSPEELAVGQRVVAGDFEGNRCTGTIVGLEQNGVVAIQLDRETFVQAPYPGPAGR